MQLYVKTLHIWNGKHIIHHSQYSYPLLHAIDETEESNFNWLHTHSCKMVALNFIIKHTPTLMRGKNVYMRVRHKLSFN
jgi:hypothetical protein